MQTSHVILRNNRGALEGMKRKGAHSLAQPASEEMSIVKADLDNREAARIARDHGVEAVAPVIPMKLIAPVDVGRERAPDVGGSAWGVAAVGADTSSFTGDGVTVAVLDTGIDSNHPAFANVTIITRNFTTEADEDLHGHGTHCAGTIFGRPVNNTRIGIAPGVKTAVIGKVLGTGGGGSDVLLEAIEWALQKGAHVISMSLGIDFPGYVAQLVQEGMPTELATSKALEGYRANVRLFERLASLIAARSSFLQPSVLIAAAGNESQRQNNGGFTIAVSPPAVAEGVISVAALASGPGGFTVAPFSNTGARIAAPGVDITSARRGGGLVPMSGTSMAAPHVAGVAALWAQKLRADHKFTGQLFLDRLMGSATMTGLASGVDPMDIGGGIIRAPQQ